MPVNNRISKVVQSAIVITLFIITSPTIIQLTKMATLVKLALPLLMILCILYYIVSGYLMTSVYNFGLLVSFLIIIFISVIASQSFSNINDIKTMFVYYSSTVVMLTIFFLNSMNKYEKDEYILKPVVIFGLLESVLGIFQALSRNSIFPTVIDGQQVVSSIYYVPGSGGTGDLTIAGGNYLLRASGTMGSGLGLGILCLCCLAILHVWRSTKLVIFSKLILYLAILLTFTGAIIMGLIAYIVFKQIIVRKPAIIKILYYLIWIFGLATQWIILHIPQGIIGTFPTIASRFNGIKYYVDVLNFGLIEKLFGQNFTNRWQGLANATFNINNRYVVDNFYMYTFFNLGILGILLLFIVYRTIIISLLRQKNMAPMVALQLSILIIGFANNISFAFGIVGIISLFAMDSQNISWIKNNKNINDKYITG